MNQRERVRERSGGLCEAMVRVWYSAHGIKRLTWTRCGKQAQEIHHRLTRARGGAVLDDLGEIYHLIDLCSRHHAMADGGPAYKTGLLIDGMMMRDGDKHYYQGTDEYLRRKYGREVQV